MDRMFVRFARFQFRCSYSFQTQVLHRQQNTRIMTLSVNGLLARTFGIHVHHLTQKNTKLFSTSPLALDFEQENECRDVINKISDQHVNNSVGRLFAVIHIAGKQRKVTNEDIIVVDKPIEADIGEKIRLNKVLLLGGKDFTLIGRPVLNPSLVKVEAVVLEKTLSHTIVSSWYKRRKDYHRLFVRKNFLTYLRIENIEMLNNS